MSEMIERIGREMLEAHGQWEKENNRFGGQVIWTPPHVDLLVRAALLAMSEPTPEMIEAGVKKLHGPVGESPYPVAEAAYRAMINQARQGGEG